MPLRTEQRAKMPSRKGLPISKDVLEISNRTPHHRPSDYFPIRWPLCGCWIRKGWFVRKFLPACHRLPSCIAYAIKREFWTQEYKFNQERLAKVIPRIGSFPWKINPRDAMLFITQCRGSPLDLYSIFVLRLLAASLTVTIKTLF